MTTRWIIGLAPGSSLDGVDAVLLQVEGVGLDLAVRPLHRLHHPYPRDLKRWMQRFGASPVVETKQLGVLHRLIGETVALAARQVVDQVSFSMQQVMCLGCAGHCLWQEPDGRFPSIFEVGMTSIIAERTGLSVISDFRGRDVAAGGQGAPLEALADHLLFRDPHESRAVVHLGGATSLVYLPPSASLPEVMGFDVGPGNLFLDSLVSLSSGGKDMCDLGGRYAVQGRCLESLLATWLEHPYWQKKPPKALPSSVFGAEFANQVVQLAKETGWERNDLMCTATHLVARAVVMALQRFIPDGDLPDHVLLSGGGVRNGLLWQLLEHQLPGIKLTKVDYADCRRAMAFGILAALTIDGVPANLPSATGAVGTRLMGSLTPGSASNWARCLGWMASQTTTGYRLAA